MRARAKERGEKPRYDRTCRDAGSVQTAAKPFCLRLRVPDAGGITRWNDLISGPAGEDVRELDDFVIARSDGSPIYHFAVVVDDHDMGITHVIRGREHMTSTPRQLLIYQALGWEPPLFAHVPLLIEPGGKKLSKRQDSVSVQSYRDRGFTPETVLNYIARLGWSHGDLEIFSQARARRAVHARRRRLRRRRRCTTTSCFWLSQHYIKTLPRERLLAHLQRFLDAEAGRPVVVDDGLAELVELLRERSKTLVEMAQLARFYYVDALTRDAKASAKFLRAGDRGAAARAARCARGRRELGSRDARGRVPEGDRAPRPAARGTRPAGAGRRSPAGPSARRSSRRSRCSGASARSRALPTL